MNSLRRRDGTPSAFRAISLEGAEGAVDAIIGGMGAAIGGMGAKLESPADVEVSLADLSFVANGWTIG